MPILTSAGYVSLGYRVQRKGRYGRWEDGPLYADRESAKTYVTIWTGDAISQGKKAPTYQILEEAV